MSFVDTKGKFHIGLDGVGLLLQGAPNAMGYRMTNAPVYGTRFASGDRDYNDLSQWWYLIQTDWSGGIKDSFSFEDDAKFYYSSNIDAYSRPGGLKLEQKLTQVRDNTANADEVLDVKTGLVNGSLTTVYLDSDRARDISSGSVYGTSNGDVNSQLFRLGYHWRFTGSVASSPHVYYWDGSADEDVVTDINSVINGSVDVAFCGVDVGGVLYIFGRSDTNKIFCVKTSLANPTTSGDFTLVFEYSVSSNAKVLGADSLGGEIGYLVESGNVLSFNILDIATGISVKGAEFNGDSTGIYSYGSRYVVKFKEELLVTILTDVDNGKGFIYRYDGDIFERIYKTDETKYSIGNQASGFLRGGAVVTVDKAYWGNLIYDGELFYNSIKTIDDDASYIAVPIGYNQSSNLLYFADTEEVSNKQQLIIYSYDINMVSGYKTGASNSAFLVMSNHDKLQSIDKLLHTVNIGFDQLASGQSISIYYTTSQTPPTANGSWTLLGTVSHTLDGATPTSKSFLFPVGTTAKKVWFRIELVGDGTNSPVLSDLTLEYLPMPDYKKQWALNINCADEVKRLDGSLVETTARELKSRLERAWWTKSALDFQDLDYASTYVNDASFDATETTVTVVSTVDFPEQGRIKVDDEEILYTGKTPTTFTGCTRGARGTRASSHSNSSVVHNAYRVIITDVDIRIPIALEDKLLEYTVGISLREV